MLHFLEHLRLFLILIVFLHLFLISCSKKESSTSSTFTCASSRTLTASTKVPLLVVRGQYANATFQSNETTWADKVFGTSDGQLNHYFDETTYSNYQFLPVNESSGCTNDGVVTVTMSGNHPDTREGPTEEYPSRPRYDCYAAEAITEAESFVNFAAYDTDSNDNISVSELQVIFLVA